MANVFRAEIVVFQAKGVYTYIERGNDNRIKKLHGFFIRLCLNTEATEKERPLDAVSLDDVFVVI